MIDWSHLGDWHEYSKLLIALLTISTPLNALPVFLSLTKNRSQAEQKRAAGAAFVTVLIVLLLFTFLGGGILAVMGITLPAFRVAGGVVVFLSALDMIRAKGDDADGDADGSTADAISLGIVPVGIPLLAGPGAISTVILFTTLHGAPTITHQVMIGIVVISTAALIYAILYAGQKLYAVMGDTGLTVLSRIMGLMLAAIAIEFMMDGIAAHFLLETVH